MSIDKPDSQKSAIVTAELLRGIQNGNNPNERLEKICAIFLKLEDEKLKEFAQKIGKGKG